MFALMLSRRIQREREGGRRGGAGEGGGEEGGIRIRNGNTLVAVDMYFQWGLHTNMLINSAPNKYRPKDTRGVLRFRDDREVCVKARIKEPIKEICITRRYIEISRGRYILDLRRRIPSSWITR